MGTFNIDYAVPSSQPRRWVRWAPYLAVVVAVGLMFFLLTCVTVGTWELRIDAVTGTTRTRTTWPLGITSGRAVNVSPLEVQLKARGVTWTRDWRFMSDNGKTILGVTTYRACSNAPPIFQIVPVMKPFAEGATDEELRAFVRVMEAGTEAEQRAAVEAAGEKGLGALGAK